MSSPAHSFGPPVRKVVTRSSQRVNGHFASRKMGGKSVPWESQIEKDFILLAELDPTVTEFYAQPLRVGYRLHGEQHAYVPDFAVVTAERTEIHEVKPDAEADELEEMFAAVAPMFAEQGMVFCVARESAIREQPKLKNAWTLWRGLHVSVPTADQQLAFASIRDRPGVPIGEMDVPEHLVHAMIAQGMLRVRLDGQLSEDSSVWLPRDFPGDERIVPFVPVR